MASTCVLVTHQTELLNQALVSLLSSSSSKHDLITSSALNLEDLMGEMTGLVPDVIVVAESRLLAGKDTLIRLLMAYPELQVIVVSEDTNWLHVFHKKDLLLTNQKDLLDIIDFGLTKRLQVDG